MVRPRIIVDITEELKKEIKIEAIKKDLSLSNFLIECYLFYKDNNKDN
jgi:hypothetical protein